MGALHSDVHPAGQERLWRVVASGLPSPFFHDMPRDEELRPFSGDELRGKSRRTATRLPARHHRVSVVSAGRSRGRLHWAGLEKRLARAARRERWVSIPRFFSYLTSWPQAGPPLMFGRLIRAPHLSCLGTFWREIALFSRILQGGARGAGLSGRLHSGRSSAISTLEGGILVVIAATGLQLQLGPDTSGSAAVHSVAGGARGCR